MNLLLGLVLAVTVPLYAGVMIALWMDSVEQARRRERSDIIKEAIEPKDKGE